MDPIAFKVPPVVKTVVHAGSPEAAFDRFTLGIGTWWPLATHSIGQDQAVSVAFERLEVGAALVERTRAGDSHVWGSILEIDRPRLLSFSWHVGRQPDDAQRIDVTFAAEPDGTTKVTLMHSGWERLGARAAEARDSYDSGWTLVLARYATTVSA